MSVDGEARAAFIHAKFYGLLRGGEALVIAGSANCSRAALVASGSAGNAELMALRRMPVADFESSLVGELQRLPAPAVLAGIGLAVRLSRISLTDYLALKWPRGRDIGVGIALLATVFLGTGLLADLTGQETPAFIADTFNTARAAGMLPLLVFSFVILGPFQEEAMFRGFLFRGFAPSFGVWPTTLLTAALWAIIHVQYQWFFMGEIFALGLVLGWLRARSGSLLLTFGLHAFVNSMAVVEAALMART